MSYNWHHLHHHPINTVVYICTEKWRNVKEDSPDHLAITQCRYNPLHYVSSPHPSKHQKTTRLGQCGTQSLWNDSMIKPVLGQFEDLINQTLCLGLKEPISRLDRCLNSSQALFSTRPDPLWINYGHWTHLRPLLLSKAIIFIHFSSSHHHEPSIKTQATSANGIGNANLGIWVPVFEPSGPQRKQFSSRI